MKFANSGEPLGDRRLTLRCCGRAAIAVATGIARLPAAERER